MSAPLDGRATIGRTRARFVHHWPWFTWLVPFGTPVLVTAVVLLLGRDATVAVIVLVATLVLATLPITLVLRAFRVRVTDRAIVLGPFLPGVPRDVHLLTDIDVSTLRAWRNVRAYTRAAAVPSILTGGRVNPGSRQGISYLARRAGVLSGNRLTENALVSELGGDFMVLSSARGAERMVRAIAAAMDDARIARADDVLRTALPPGTLSGEPGSHLREMPGHPGPRQESRLEDLPPEMQKRMRQHLR